MKTPARFAGRVWAACVLLPAFALVPGPSIAADERPGGTDPGGGRADTAPDLSGVGRVVAIGDVHGDLAVFRRLLRASKLVDEDLAWTGGATVFVQTGDLLDRGADSRHVLELVMRLEGEAKKAGGRVVFVVGNHEVFNIVGDLRYLHVRELAPYAAEESEDEYRAALADLEGFLDEPKPLLASDFYARKAREWRESGFHLYFPPGYFRHRKLFAPTGRYGKWILEHEVVVKIDRILYSHAGLSPRFGTMPLASLRKRFREELREHLSIVDELVRLDVFHRALGFGTLLDLIKAERATRRVDAKLRPLFARLDALFDGPVFAEDGPVFYRGLALESERLLERDLGRILAAQDAERIVIGHTQPLDLRIRSRFGGRVILIDTGMNQEYRGGTPQALVIREGGKPTVIGIK